MTQSNRHTEAVLTPCPFCGGEARVVIADDQKSVECVSCGAASCVASEKMTVAAWNRRVVHAGELERLREALDMIAAFSELPYNRENHAVALAMARAALRDRP